MRRTAAIILAAAAALLLEIPSSKAQSSPTDLSGLWAAKVRYGPDARGPLIVLRNGRGWIADVAGFRLAARGDNNSISFELPDDKGHFRGRRNGREIVGHWFGPKSWAYATPMTLRPDGVNRWRGEVSPLDNTFTFYMPMTRRPDGTYATYLRNPERNQGRFIPVSSVRVNGDAVELSGRRGNDANAVIARGFYDDGTIRVPLRGATFDFTKVDNQSSSAFYPRGKPPQRYSYAKPLELDDGWPVAAPEDVGISRDGIEKFVQMLIDMSMDSITTSQIHSLLIARRGKLVVEEYFHGYDRFTPHDTRSAAKSWVAVLLGAAIHAGVRIRTTTPVYQTMLGSLPPDLDPRKRAMTLEHLISMTAGYNCAADDAPGNEDVMQEQREEPDWYRYTLNVPMLTAPGDTIVYCSIEPNLAGGMLQKIAGEPLPEMFYRLVAKPMQMNDYHLFLSPTGDAYGGGGHHFLPRDFMKLAQLMLNQGKWAGRQITSSEWAVKSGSALRNLTRTQQYGWLWNSVEYSHRGRKVRALFAGGNGGQIFMAIPDLELAIAFTGGNYAQAATFTAQREFVPRYILPAID
ncbi:MAG: serine hydrolase [Gemmatimonadaceae bacterium]|nr:serine hydrolase [Gemmatimonadaceae bacterium]